MAVKKRRSGVRKRSSRKKGTGRGKGSGTAFSLRSEVILLLILAISIIIFICNIGKGGTFGRGVSAFFFGAFGLMAYVFPFWLFFISAFLTANQKHSGKVIMKTTAGILLLVFLCVLIHLLMNGTEKVFLFDAVKLCAQTKNGGGFLGIVLGSVFVNAFGLACSYVVTIAVLIISGVLLTERSFFGGIKKGSSRVYRTAKEDAAKRKQQQEIRAERRKTEQEARKKRRMDQKVSGVAVDTTIIPPEKKSRKSDDISELKIDSDLPPLETEPLHELDMDNHIAAVSQQQSEFVKEEISKGQSEGLWGQNSEPVIHVAGEMPVSKKAVQEPREAEQKTVPQKKKQKAETSKEEISEISSEIASPRPDTYDYEFPSVSLLKKGDPNASGDSRQHLQEMSAKLQMTLTNFGVKAHVTNVTCGPSVTRYEIQPEMGVKVSKIVGLTDDIKLNLAVADIRMEAPIPGKAAIGIEVPNKENVTVAFRDLVESNEFQGHSSNISFAAGKDIAGNVIVADIAKMPHLLIAGATGSGKSVCINTIIMSILYKAHPDDVKLIMIDPKVVELSVYNGIPHLFIPVVTDPKKAAGALHWAVAEMTDRYQKFAEYNVRDLKGYNKKIESIKDIEDENKPQKMPQIVIIVDELADLMMVAPGDVEDAICRLAQLARAAGIHLIIATQRPSVNVITGLIKANMPSRIAFSVTSGVDSRTILDMNGAEKLLGKGDMLFYPQGYQKPVRVQGAFVSDREVSDVVDFLTEKNGQVSYSAEIEEKVKHAAASSVGGGGGLSAPSDDRDAYFAEAGKFIIEKEKGSIGMLQRMFKVGFNRAARIMDQLEEAGVVGPEEGTKPRKVLMSMEEFEQYVDEYV
ncbi:Stage III sporulation protein E [uncultured Roseburia sp.]|uniref:DNA translocase FtsK n=1 Tax=Brotonthovivens ammoniilytica TaxID=2981725 RepID=A0ABT2TG45_9FIRM|nr:DNA translocase FtsK [Brotonthovivens ammoniilytica]MCU6761170.1 DNA translocase FtsK [Brotonthovivens ammoniilytica]SCI20949.1 Stage III sporulation protein E [uncultured Roseburia sp.]